MICQLRCSHTIFFGTHNTDGGTDAGTNTVGRCTFQGHGIRGDRLSSQMISRTHSLSPQLRSKTLVLLDDGSLPRKACRRLFQLYQRNLHAAPNTITPSKHSSLKGLNCVNPHLPPRTSLSEIIGVRQQPSSHLLRSGRASNLICEKDPRFNRGELESPTPPVNGATAMFSNENRWRTHVRFKDGILLQYLCDGVRVWRFRVERVVHEAAHLWVLHSPQGVHGDQDRSLP